MYVWARRYLSLENKRFSFSTISRVSEGILMELIVSFCSFDFHLFFVYICSITIFPIKWDFLSFTWIVYTDRVLNRRQYCCHRRLDYGSGSTSEDQFEWWMMMRRNNLWAKAVHNHSIWGRVVFVLTDLSFTFKDGLVGFLKLSWSFSIKTKHSLTPESLWFGPVWHTK